MRLESKIYPCNIGHSVNVCLRLASCSNDLEVVLLLRGRQYSSSQSLRLSTRSIKAGRVPDCMSCPIAPDAHVARNAMSLSTSGQVRSQARDNASYRTHPRIHLRGFPPRNLCIHPVLSNDRHESCIGRLNITPTGKAAKPAPEEPLGPPANFQSTMCNCSYVRLGSGINVVSPRTDRRGGGGENTGLVRSITCPVRYEIPPSGHTCPYTIPIRN